MPRFAQASASAFRMSRLDEVASTTLYLLTADLNIAKPSWCFEVMTMYFMPASCASWTHSAGLHLTGLNCAASFSYSVTGSFERFMIHSPSPGDRVPCQSPAGMADNAQGVNIPYLTSRNHSRHFSQAASE